MKRIINVGKRRKSKDIIISNNNMQLTEKLISNEVIEKNKINHDQIFRRKEMLQKSKKQIKNKIMIEKEIA